MDGAAVPMNGGVYTHLQKDSRSNLQHPPCVFFVATWIGIGTESLFFPELVADAQTPCFPVSLFP